MVWRLWSGTKGEYGKFQEPGESVYARVRGDGEMHESPWN